MPQLDDNGAQFKTTVRRCFFEKKLLADGYQYEI